MSARGREPALSAYAQVGAVFVRHQEFGGSRVGHARFDPNTGYFTCRTCGFERVADDVGQCSTPGCPGRLRYDSHVLACTEDPTHVYPMTTNEDVER